MHNMCALDFFTVPTATFRVLFVLIAFSHDRRQVFHFNVTAHPSMNWTAQQVVEAFPWDTLPRYLLRDRDSIYGSVFRERLKHMGIKEVITSVRSPWQNAYVERLIGSIMRECLDHVIVLNERHLKRILSSYFEYYHQDRTHCGLNKDTPSRRSIESKPQNGKIMAIPRVGGLHHRYQWRKAA